MFPNREFHPADIRLWQLKRLESSALQYGLSGVSLEQAVKQRLVGAAVLTALAVITLPLIFDTSRPPVVQVPEAIPIAPQQPRITMPEPQPVELPAEAGEPQPVGEMYTLDGENAGDTSVADQDKTAEVNETVVDPAQSVPAPEPAPAPVAPTKSEPVPPPAPAPKTPPKEKPPTVAKAPPTSPAAKLDTRGVPESWVVQVAAVTDRKKADSLVAQLTLEGHSAFTRSSRDSKGETIRVFVGPKMDKAQAQRIKKQIDSEHGYQSMVKPFSP